jgi:hypothetical protein
LALALHLATVYDTRRDARTFLIRRIRMSLFKLAVYGAIGYVVYQIFVAENPMGSSGGGGGGGRAQQRQRGGRGQGGSSRLSGPGRGRSETVEDADGGRSTRTVGRGVTT